MPSARLRPLTAIRRAIASTSALPRWLDAQPGVRVGGAGCMHACKLWVDPCMHAIHTCSSYRQRIPSGHACKTHATHAYVHTSTHNITHIQDRRGRRGRRGARCTRPARRRNMMPPPSASHVASPALDPQRSLKRPLSRRPQRHREGDPEVSGELARSANGGEREDACPPGA